MTKHLKTHWRACGLALIAATAQLAFTAPVQAQAQAAPDTLAKVRSEGVICLGVRDNAAPFAYVDAKGKPGGFTWEVCRALVKNLEAELGRPIEIKVVPNAFAAPFHLLKDGRIDMQCGATTHSAERAKQADFSNTFFVSGIAVAYRKEDVQYANPLKFGRVAVLANSTAAKIMERRMGAKGSASIDTMVPVKSYEEGVAKLKAKDSAGPGHRPPPLAGDGGALRADDAQGRPRLRRRGGPRADEGAERPAGAPVRHRRQAGRPPEHPDHRSVAPRIERTRAADVLTRHPAGARGRLRPAPSR